MRGGHGLAHQTVKESLFKKCYLDNSLKKKVTSLSIGNSIPYVHHHHFTVILFFSFKMNFWLHHKVNIIIIIIHILNIYFPCLHGLDKFLNGYLPLSLILCQITINLQRF